MFAFVLNGLSKGLFGLWAGMAVGYTVVTLIVMVAVYRSDWAQIAKDAIARAETTTPLLGEKLLGDGAGAGRRSDGGRDGGSDGGREGEEVRGGGGGWGDGGGGVGYGSSEKTSVRGGGEMGSPI